MKIKTRAFVGVAVVLFTVALLVSVVRWVASCKQIRPDWPKRCGAMARLAWPKYKMIEFAAPYASYLLGYDHPVSYLILLQNDTEMRANGGFFGSYAVATLEQGRPEIRFQDIYAPDGQLGAGHIEAPRPIEEAFKKGGFYLRDSDWDPDFTNAAKTIRWFFEKGGEVKPDVMVTISLSTIKKILHIVGPIAIPDYAMTISEENIFSLVQAKVETDFFPGSTQKKDILTGIGRAIMARLEYLPITKKLEITKILMQEMLHKNILVNTTNPGLQTSLEEVGYAGGLRYPKCLDGENECLLDTFMAVEANLGANKANCCTTRKTTHRIEDKGEIISHEITIEYTNNSKEENPKLPDFFGGNYIDYVRFYIPKESTNLVVVASPTLPTTLAYYPEPYSDNLARLDVSDYYLFKIAGMFHTTRAGTSSRVKMSYDLPNTATGYELHILKQHGMQTSPQEIVLGDKTESTSLEDDYVFSGVK